ncbi:hypothetical protein KF146HA_00289 [Lactococcus lactis]|nr:hypothetical protein [Lactococcus lactis]
MNYTEFRKYVEENTRAQGKFLENFTDGIDDMEFE